MDPYRRFEVEFGTAVAQWGAQDWDVNEDRMVACSTGSAALHLALETARLPQGSEVIVPDYTMIACARAAAMADLEPVFVDIDPRTLLVDLPDLENSITGDTEALMVVHVYGRRVDMERVASIADRWGLFLVEDLAEAHGLAPHPRTDAACWSFYRNKIIAGEEGGAILYRSSSLANRARSLRSMGFTQDHDYRHQPRGWNYRLSNLHAHAILSSLSELPESMRRRILQVDAYDHLLPQEEMRMPPRDANWVYDLRIPGMKKAQQDQLVKLLQSSGIAARHGFVPMTRQPEFYRSDRKSPRADRVCSEIIYLPVHPRFVSAESIETSMRLLKGFVEAM